MHEQQEILYELWPEEQVEKKSHSRLYSLEPVRMGSPMVESLTSYIVRLAEAHSVYPRALILHEIVPLLKLLSLHQNGHFVYDCGEVSWKDSCILNGRTTQTGDMVQALEQLTSRHDLHFLTMLPWQFVLSSRKLLRRTRAWCPLCYQEWRNKNQTLYEPLLWSLEVINVCHRHRLRLQTRCPNSKCNQVQLPLSQHAQSGYCSRCNSWLGSLPQGEAGESLAFEDNEWAWQLWIVHSVGDLLSAAPALTDAPQRERILFTIDIYAEKLTRGQRVTLFHQLECNSSIENWFYKTQTLQLSHLLHFCFRLGASPLQLLLGNIEEAAVEKHTPVDMPTKRYWKFDEERIQQMLEAILKSEGSSPSMEEVARQLGYKYRQIYKRFPELCRAISAKYMASPIFTKTVQVTLGVTRSITIQQQCRRFDSERVLQALESALQISEGDPPSMTTVAKDLGYYPGYIRKHFPELCRAISKRYKEAQAAKGVQRVQLICTNVKEIVFAIHKQGRYPSKRQVSKYLKNRAVLREREVLCAWKEAVQELGWEQQDLSVPG